MSLFAQEAEAPPINPAEAFAALTPAPAVVSSLDRRFAEAEVLQLTQRAVGDLDAYQNDHDRVMRQRFTLAELRERGGLKALIADIGPERLEVATQAITKLERLIGRDGRVALGYACGIVPDYLQVSALLERLASTRQLAESLIA